MRLLYVADGRSPIARSWIQHFVGTDHEVHLLSTFVCEPLPGLASLTIVPVAFSGLARAQTAASRPRLSPGATGAGTIHLRTTLRHWLGPLTLRRAAGQARQAIADIQPDLLHAMRIPFEGALAAACEPDSRLLVSVWGNDFSLHAPATPMMRGLTRRTMVRADALHTDCQRDQRLAMRWGFRAGRPAAVLPGNGGVREDLFYAGESGEPTSPELAHALRAVPANAPVVVNPRGFRAYVRSDTFFRSIPMVLAVHPDAVFLCAAMAGERQANRWIERLGIQDSVQLLPKLSPSDMGVLFRRSWVMVSASEHDGTPNSLLEAMACGAYPVCGDLESIREWIVDGQTGSLVDPRDPGALAQAVSRVLTDEPFRAEAARQNGRTIAKRASYGAGMALAEAFYREILA